MMLQPVYYDALLVDASDKGTLLFKHNGELKKVPTLANIKADICELAEQKNSVGLVGWIEADEQVGFVSYKFQPYPDQTLRRVTELDDGKAEPNVIREATLLGWRNASQPAGFLHPQGSIPNRDSVVGHNTFERVGGSYE